MAHSPYKVLVAGLLLTAASPSSVALRDGRGELAAVSGPAVMLFWAAWCGPCRIEIDNFAALERSAAPMKLIVVATDGSPRSRQLLRGVPVNQLRFPADPSVDVMSMLGDRSNGLPVALAIDANGQVCASRRGGVAPDDLALWRTLCLKKP